jgi:hypothetical protein
LECTNDEGGQKSPKKMPFVNMKITNTCFFVDGNFMFILPTFFLMAILRTYSFIVLGAIEK